MLQTFFEHLSSNSKDKTLQESHIPQVISKALPQQRPRDQKLLMNEQMGLWMKPTLGVKGGVGSAAMFVRNIVQQTERQRGMF